MSVSNFLGARARTLFFLSEERKLFMIRSAKRERATKNEERLIRFFLRSILV